jgi:hypothetical protein
MAIDGHCRREPLPLPSRLYLSAARDPATSPLRNRAPTHPRPHARTVTVEKSRPPRHCRPLELPVDGKVSLPLLSCFFFASVAQSSFNLNRRISYSLNRAPPPSSSSFGRRRRSSPSLHPRRPNHHQLAFVW